MALRHGFPVGSALEPKTSMVTPAMMRKPTVVEFRRGADLNAVAHQVAKEQSVLLDAAVGSGKSTKFPLALAAETKGLVYHVVPNAMLALSLYNYVVKIREQVGEVGASVELCHSVDQTIPRNGVYYISSAQLVALYVEQGNIANGADVTLFLDEAHESDACTHLLRNLAIAMGASRLVQSSATMSPGGSRARETPGSLQKFRFSTAQNPSEWDVLDPKAPWSYLNAQENMLIFLDSDTHADRLVRDYTRMGIDAFRLRAGMKAEAFVTAMAALNDKKGAMCVLVADTSFRSGFTFDVGCIVDSGAVGFFDPTPGSVRKLYRKMYLSESEQAAGRGGRIRAGKLSYYYPDCEIQAKICDLEGTEREAAAYLSRCMGFEPIGVLAESIMSTHDLPAMTNKAGAFNGFYPLTYYVVNSKGERRAESPAPRESRASTPPPQYEAANAEAPVLEKKDSALDLKDLLAPVEALALKPGVYYHVIGVNGLSDAGSTQAFPNGVLSVRRFLSSDAGTYSVAGLARRDREQAIAMVLNRYNLLNVEIDAIDSFIRDLAKAGHKNLRSQVRTYVAEIFESATRIRGERIDLLSCLDLLVAHDYDIQDIQPLSRLVVQRASAYMSRFKDLQDCDGCTGEEYARMLEDRAAYGDTSVKPRHLTEGRDVGRHVRHRGGTSERGGMRIDERDRGWDDELRYAKREGTWYHVRQRTVRTTIEF